MSENVSENIVQKDSNSGDFNVNLCNETKIINFTNEQGVIVNFTVYKKMNNYENCVCKLIISEYNSLIECGTGFFCYIPSKDMRVLITNYHNIDDEFLNNEKKLRLYIVENEIEKEKIIDLKMKRNIITDKSLDVTIIEILDEDLIDGYFEYDEDAVKDKEFLNEPVFNLQFQKGGELKGAFGKIIDTTTDKTKFTYDAGSDFGSSGSPIVLANGYKIIGIHKAGKKGISVGNKINLGIYLCKTIESIPESTRPENKNTIKCLYEIKKEDVNKNIKVYDNKNNIEKDINSISIYREDEKKNLIIDGIYNFKKEGKYFIYYKVNNSVKNLSDMFCDVNTLKKVYMPSLVDNKIERMSNMFDGCSSLKEINFPRSFNTKNVLDVSYMFSYCQSLKNLNLSSFNTENVENMSGMLNKCKYLTEVNLSSFNTKNVENMSDMFNGCESLTEINLLSFDTENVKSMAKMFRSCQKLKEINLSKFKTNFVCDLSCMFENCCSLKMLDLSSFNTINVNDMNCMFMNCTNLKEIDLSAFKTSNNTKIRDMFLGCESLKSIKKCSDNNILNEYKQ